MITLECENRILTQDAKYSYLSTNYASGVSSITILNATDFAANNILLLGNIGSESTEIVTASTVNTTTGVIALTSSTKFAHAESTKVTIIPYNQVLFEWSATSNYWTGPNTNMSGYIAIQVSDWFTKYNDESHSTGYGWYTFYNSITAVSSQPSNYLPYTGFDRDTVEDVLNDFYSLLNNKELKLVSRRDALSWFNEGYSRMRNRLNRTNVEFSATSLQTLSIVSGQIEYALPSDFYQLVSITADLNASDPGQANNMSKYAIEYISLREAYSYTGSDARYYIRGAYIGILPTPTTATTYHYMYLTKTGKLDSNSEVVDLPDNGFYAIKDFMMYRAYMKFNNPNAALYYKMFEDNLNQMVIAAVDRDADLDRWDIDDSANV